MPFERSTTMYFAMFAVTVYRRFVTVRFGASAAASHVTWYVPAFVHHGSVTCSKVFIGTSTVAPDLSTYSALKLMNANASGYAFVNAKSMSTLPFHG